MTKQAKPYRIFMLIMIAFILTANSCAAQHRHHKAVPCPCEKNNKR